MAVGNITGVMGNVNLDGGLEKSKAEILNEVVQAEVARNNAKAEETNNIMTAGLRINGGYLASGNYSQAELIKFFMQYGNSAMQEILREQILTGSMVYRLNDVTRTISIEETLTIFVAQNSIGGTISVWTPTMWEKFSMWQNQFQVDTLADIAQQAILGPYSDSTSLGGTAAQIGVNFIPGVDTLADIRDIAYSTGQMLADPSLSNLGWMGLDLLGLIPFLGALKPIVKSDDVVDSVGVIVKNADVGKNADDVADAVSDIAKRGDDAVNKVAATAKRADELPENVQDSLKNYEGNDWNGKSDKTSGTKDGGSFRNDEGKLPKQDAYGNDIQYRECDVNNKQTVQSRDAERFVTGSDGTVYYTDDHYETFIKVE